MPDYFLSDDIYVKCGEDAANFEARVKGGLAPGGVLRELYKEPFCWTLKLALKSTEPILYAPPKKYGSEIHTDSRGTGEKELRCERYLHIWDVKDPPDVAKVMQRLADSSEYAAINAVVFEEVQHQVLSIAASAQSTHSAGDTFVVLRQQLRTADLGTHLFNLDLLGPLMAAKKWRNFGRLQSVTGYLNSIMQLWQVPADDAAVPTSHHAKTLKLPAKSLLADTAVKFDSTPRAEWRDTMKAYVTP